MAETLEEAKAEVLERALRRQMSAAALRVAVLEDLIQAVKHAHQMYHFRELEKVGATFLVPVPMKHAIRRAARAVVEGKRDGLGACSALKENPDG